MKWIDKQGQRILVLAAVVTAFAGAMAAMNPWLLKDKPSSLPTERSSDEGQEATPKEISSAKGGSTASPAPESSQLPEVAEEAKPKREYRGAAVEVPIGNSSICNPEYVTLKHGESCSFELATAIVTVRFVERFGKSRPSVTVSPGGGESVTEGFVGPGSFLFVADSKEWRLSLLSINGSERSVDLAIRNK